MAGNDPSSTDRVAAAFARLIAEAHAAPPLEARNQPAGTRLDRSLGVLNWVLVLTMLLAVVLSTCALLNL